MFFASATTSCGAPIPSTKRIVDAGAQVASVQTSPAAQTMPQPPQFFRSLLESKQRE
jgi:hypothetical protein